MARTINGRLRGRAARTELNDTLISQAAARQEFSDAWTQAVIDLKDMLCDKFDAWWDSYPNDMTKGEFLPIMQAKIRELETEHVVDEAYRLDEKLYPNYDPNPELIDMARDWEAQKTELRNG